MTEEPGDAVVRFPAARLILAMVIVGTVGAFAKEAAVEPMTLVFWRCLFATIFLGPWCILSGAMPDATSLSVSGIVFAVLSGVCMVLGWTTFFQGLSMTSIGTATIVFHVHPFLLMLMSVLLLKERIDLHQVAWMASAFVGVVLASGVAAADGAVDLRWAQGICVTLAAAVLHAAATLLAKWLGRQPPQLTALCQTATGIFMLAPFLGALEPVPASSWGWLLGIGIFHTGVAYVLMYSAYPRLRTPTISALAFIYPMVAIAVDWAVYDRLLGWMEALGAGLIAAGTLGVRLGWHVLPRRRDETRESRHA